MLQLSQRDIDAIAQKVAVLVTRKLLATTQKLYPDMVTTEEAAAILRITPARMRQIKNQYPYEKCGDDHRGRLLFKRDALYRSPRMDGKSK